MKDGIFDSGRSRWHSANNGKCDRIKTMHHDLFALQVRWRQPPRRRADPPPVERHLRVWGKTTMRLHGPLKIISTEFRAAKSRLRFVRFPGHATGCKIVFARFAPIRASQNARRKPVWPEIALRDTATITVSRT